MHASKYQPHIDGLRALAVAAVLTYHFRPDLLPGGFRGVDIFFVISGFVVASSGLERGTMPFLAFFTDFLARRIRRIAPALLVCLLVTSLASSLWMPKAWLSDSIPDTGRAAFFGLSNFVLYRHANDYFSHVAAFNPFTHTWSLAVEEQFYLIAPALFWLWSHEGRARVFSTVTLLVATLSSIAYALRLAGDGDAGAYYLLTTRFWELAAGVLLCLGLKRFGRMNEVPGLSLRWLRGAGAFLALALLVGTFFQGGGVVLDGSKTPLAVAATVVLLACLQGAHAASPATQVLSLEPMRYVGRMSYSLYLWHWPIMVVFRWTFGLADTVPFTAAIALSAFFAWVSWRWIERPSSRVLLRLRPGKLVIAGVSTLALGALIGQTLQKNQYRLSPSVVAKHRDDWYPTRGQKLIDSDGCTVVPARMQLSHGWKATFERTACGRTTSGPAIVVIGDSHALSYGPMFARYAMETGARVTVYNNGGCPMLSLQPVREAAPGCMASASAALADATAALRAGDVVFLPSLRLPRYVDQDVVRSDSLVESMVSGEEAVAARHRSMPEAESVVRRLLAAGARVVIQVPSLLFKAPPFRCADWWTVTNPVCAHGMAMERSSFERLRAPVVASLGDLAAIDDRVDLFDPLPSLCPSGESCSAFRNSKPLFFDGDHLSAHGNEVIYPAFLAAMRGQAPAILMPRPSITQSRVSATANVAVQI
jgi:peptidoglycan/LPS O-acetylase OafA/YrhL